MPQAGDVGFDPFGFSSTFNVKWLREAEIKHGRLCMLAWVGFVATDLGFTLPGDMHQVSSVEAHDVACKYGAMSQIFLWIGFVEVVHSSRGGVFPRSRRRRRPLMNRGDAAAAARIVRGGGRYLTVEMATSRGGAAAPTRGIPRRRVAVAPRLPRG